MSHPHLVGWAHTRFGTSELPDVESLIGEVSSAALADAEVDPSEVDAIFVGVFNHGFSRQGFEGALVGSGTPELALVPAMRAENACATGSAALYAAFDRIEAGRATIALVVGAEKMTATGGPALNDILLGASHRASEGNYSSFAHVFADLADRYADRYGDPHDAMAMIAAKNHRHGVDNPYAHLRKDVGYEFCATPSERNPVVSGRLLRTDCSMVSDGAAALVVTGEDVARGRRRAVAVTGRGQANDHLAIAARRDPLELAGARAAFAAALRGAGIGLDGLDLLETHDCFTVAELLQYEAFGIAEPGKAAQALADGVTNADGRVPVNRSGGLKAKGHPLGATGVSQHVMAAMQLVGEAGDMQLPSVDRAAVFNMGGAAVANYASVLERAR
ncbi:thiolase domain-containing protein [Nocardioides acrostichi]|uniref:Thiolase domain-containing protein n=1 Tax=Nocardioides acrostichi TaxID=2784339 RepID=A0A930YBR9_9ACTN|nr:thiolase domain-containing protein [Nocardioides acrostichi]MBF4160749.1 thiolase domain-containing protein [Nocardioides acrostichi]